LENAQQGLPATPRGRPGQGRAGHVRTTGANAVGKDWLSGLAIPLEKTKTVRCQRKWDWDIWDWGWDGEEEEEEEMILAAHMHAAAASAGNVELRTQRRATVAGSAQQPFRCRRRTNAGGRMREPGSAAQEAHTEEGSWRTKGADKAV
jgi:hypothetical protein